MRIVNKGEAMTATSAAQTGNHDDWRLRTALARRRFNAWWEGYAFDLARERAALQLNAGAVSPSKGSINPERLIVEGLWGQGRTDPGNAAWTMRHARTLGAGLKARIVVLGAGHGAPLRDLKTGTKWKVSGYGSSLQPGAKSVRGLSLHAYEDAIARGDKGGCEGGLCFFDLHRDKDPAALAQFAAQLVRPNAPFSFVDYVVPRRTTRLRSAFPEPWHGAPRTTSDYAHLLESAGFRVVETLDETRAFLPLITQGWGRWKTVYDHAGNCASPGERAAFLQMFGHYADVWAERLAALRSGQLSVVRFQARKAG